jgi:hypothetical protein
MIALLYLSNPCSLTNLLGKEYGTGNVGIVEEQLTEERLKVLVLWPLSSVFIRQQRCSPFHFSTRKRAGLPV